MGWFEVIAIIVAAIAVVLLPVAWIIARRRWLNRRGGLFECSVRLRTTTPGTGWVLGVARYREERLEWFPAFSVSMRPRLVFRRPMTRAAGQRPPDQYEALLLMEDQRVIRLDSGGGENWELSMTTDALTGLLSWLESAPPGQQRYQRPVG